jgi:hypothetical protein
MEAWILKPAWIINAWLLSDSKIYVGGNPGLLTLFSEVYQALVIDSSDIGIPFESQHQSKMSEQPIVAAPPPAFLPATTGRKTAYHNAGKDFAYIQDTRERLRIALAEIEAPFRW